MNKNSPLYDYEIDLVALFKIIWDGKIKILFITIISFLVGLGYNSQIPINYSNSLTINLSKDIELINFANTQKLIRSNSLNSLNSLNSSKIFKIIIKISPSKLKPILQQLFPTKQIL